MSLTIVLTLIPNVPFVQPAIFCIRKTKYFHDCYTELSYYVYVNFVLFAVFVGLFVRSFVCFTSNIKRNTQNYYYSGQKSQGRFHARHSGIQIQKCSGCQSQNHGTVPNRKTPERV